MAKIVLTAGFLSFGGTNISSYVNQINLSTNADPVEVSTFGDVWRMFAIGMRTWELTFDGINDYAASAIDSILWPLQATEVAIEVRPTNAAVGAGNPKFTGDVLFLGYSPIAAQLGAVPALAPQIRAHKALTRATS